MKKRLVIRIIGIGFFHAFLYLYVVPFYLYPKYGDNGLKFAVLAAVLASVAIIGTMFVSKNFKGDDKNG